MELHNIYLRFGVALAIGFLVGLERQRAEKIDDPNNVTEAFGGTRTFSLLGLTGCLAAMAADLLESPLIFVGIVVLK